MPIREDLDRLKIADLPLHPAIIIFPGTSLFHAARLMRDHRIGCAFAVDDAGQATGRLTDEWLLALIACGPHHLQAEAIQHLAPLGPSLKYHQPVSRLMRVMAPANDASPWVCILNEQNHPVALAGPDTLNQFLAGYVSASKPQPASPPSALKKRPATVTQRPIPSFGGRTHDRNNHIS